MKKNKNRRAFLQKLGAISLASGIVSLIPLNCFSKSLDEGQTKEAIELKSLSPSQLFSVLDLYKPELSKVQKALNQKGHDAALSELLSYYRKRFPKSSESDENATSGAEAKSFERADNLGKHIFQWGPYAPANYGPDIDWAADPAGDIEWVASVYRFPWVTDLARAYAATGDERYAQIFVDLTLDWIRKHPLEKTVDCIHPVYGWKGYPWLDLQTGIRANNLCNSFYTMVHAKSFTPQFLGTLLASLYDHQNKTEKMPMGRVHNKAIFEQRGFFKVIHTFPEFKDKERWLEIAEGITAKSLIDQTTPDGVQREWCGGYHLAVYSDAIQIDGLVRDFGRKMPDNYEKRIQLMADYIFGISTPELGFPMFGDTGRKQNQSKDRKSYSLYGVLAGAGKRFEDPKFRALADLNLGQLPANGSIAFPEAGMYAMRSSWTPDQVYMALHCSPPGISSHDTPDNGTFELYAYGIWLMPDTGFYTYGHDPKARAWHRQTRVHPTLTIGGKDTQINGRQLHWQSDENTDILCVENQSYQSVTHRRTIWFSGKKSELPFFVILDEAIGDVSGDMEIHFPMAPGTVSIDNQSRRINTGYENANLLIQIEGKNPVSLSKEEGWTSCEYGQREPRTAVTAVSKGDGSAFFISILVPYRGENAPVCRLLTNPEANNKGGEIQVEVAGRKHTFKTKVSVANT